MELSILIAGVVALAIGMGIMFTINKELGSLEGEYTWNEKYRKISSDRIWIFCNPKH